MESRSRAKDLLNAVQSDCRFAVRQLRKSPGFAVIAILTLALGVGANTAIFSICSVVLFRPLAYPHAERLVKANVYDLKSGDLYGSTSYPDFVDWSEQNQFFDCLAAYESKTFNLSRAKEPEHVKGEVVSSDFFETPGIQPSLGRALRGERNQEAVVLSHALWSRSFGSDPHVIGRSIALDGYAYEVVGVMPRSFQFPDPEAELWALISEVRPDLREEITARGNLGFFVIGRLGSNATLSQAQAGITAIASGLEQKYPEADRDLGVRLVPLQESMVGKFRPALLILMGAAVLVLLIACANIATLLLARAAARQSEIAIRSSLGASRNRILAQLLTESILLALIGGMFSALFAFPLMDLIL